MSIKSWIEEFMPVSADEVADSTLDMSSIEVDRLIILHSLRKWRGFRKRALRKHSVTLDDGVLKDSRTKGVMMMGPATCALCTTRHFNDCIECPLYNVRKVPCFDPAGNKKNSPLHYAYEGNISPMMRLLNAALKENNGQMALIKDTRKQEKEHEIT